jgi:hypothetical protein
VLVTVLSYAATESNNNPFRCTLMNFTLSGTGKTSLEQGGSVSSAHRVSSVTRQNDNW